jgi:hypothetical protein
MILDGGNVEIYNVKLTKKEIIALLDLLAVSYIREDNNTWSTDTNIHQDNPIWDDIYNSLELALGFETMEDNYDK